MPTMPEREMRIGVFGGTFDPPHRAHLEIALAAIDALRLDHLEMIPTRRPPHRPQAETSSWHRHAMCVLAALDHPKILVSTREFDRGGTSYTIDTLEELRREHPLAEIFLVLGGDAYRDLREWKDWQGIIDIARLAVISRPRRDGDDAQRWPEGLPPMIEIPMKPSPISASTIRERLAKGETPGDALDRRVLSYLERHGLYRASRTGNRGLLGHNPTDPSNRNRSNQSDSE